jgi:branched-subunit amino acid aminotransferase/4-amino-4-deoxychorismate lyase
MSTRDKTVTTINGERVPHSRAKISVYDNSLLYAEGLFETFLACGDRVMFLEEHLDRLYKGAAVIALKPPVGRRRLAAWMKQTLTAHPDRIKKLRLTITSGESQRWTGVSGRPQVILMAGPHTIPTRPFRLQVSNFKVDQDSEFRRIKTISYAIHAAAVKRAQAKGYDDALMLNNRGHVAEATSANIFWCRRGRIHTPPLSAGCLEGTTRHVVLREARKLGLRVTERSVSLERVAETDEIFVSSSLKLVLGVSEIAHGRRRFRFSQGEITETIMNRVYGLAGIERPQ